MSKPNFYHKYELAQDTPKYKKGWPIRWSGQDEKYYPYKPSDWVSDKGSPSIYLDKSQQYTMEEVSQTEWFTPVGDPKPFIPPFSSLSKLNDFVYLEFETRLVADVDECRAMKKLFKTDKFTHELYEFVKSKYNEFHNLPTQPDDHE